jgi:lipopolysaccharide assembly LptE-like protein
VKLRALKFFAIGAAAALFAGCAAYHLGPVNGAIAGEKSIEVLPFNNQTLEPRLGDSVTQALRERLQADGTYRLGTGGAADVIVTGVITRYNRKGLSFLNTDVATPENYRVEITAHVTARDSGSGKVLLDKEVNGYTLVQVGLDLASADRQAQPLLAEDLARNVAELLTEGAW